MHTQKFGGFLQLQPIVIYFYINSQSVVFKKYWNCFLFMKKKTAKIIKAHCVFPKIAYINIKDLKTAITNNNSNNNVDEKYISFCLHCIFIYVKYNKHPLFQLLYVLKTTRFFTWKSYFFFILYFHKDDNNNHYQHYHKKNRINFFADCFECAIETKNRKNKKHKAAKQKRQTKLYSHRQTPQLALHK